MWEHFVWLLKTGCCLIEVTTNTGLTVYSSIMLNPQPSYGKGQPEGTFEYNLKSMNSSVYEHVHHCQTMKFCANNIQWFHSDTFNWFLISFDHVPCCSMPQGRLFDYICSTSVFDELHAAEFIHQLLEAVLYLHNCRIAHLDIKVRLFVPCTFFCQITQNIHFKVVDLYWLYCKWHFRILQFVINNYAHVIKSN